MRYEKISSDSFFFSFRCGHPHDDPGSHAAPPDGHNLILEEEPLQGWKIEFHDFIR